ncbi:MAG TPA: hypothetical protein DCS93_03810 [Microscillaceae bacterium]|nr:hypothetical protein [Microscillaceae bacterium]
MTQWNNFLYSSEGSSEQDNHLIKIKKLLKTRETTNIDLAFQLLRSLQQPADLTLHRLLKATDVNKALGLYFEQGIYRFLPFKQKCLSLSGCSIQRFPEDLAEISFLHHLYLSFNPIEVLPERIDYLPVLQTLDLTNTSIEKLPVSLSKLGYLKHLYLSGTHLSDLSLLTALPKLQVLSLNKALATQLTPQLLKKWPYLQKLYVQEAYSDLPEKISNLPIVQAWEQFAIVDYTSQKSFVRFQTDQQKFALQIGYWGERVISELEWANFERWLGIYKSNPLPETNLWVVFHYQDNIGGWQILMRLLDTLENLTKIKITWVCDEDNHDGWEMMEVLKDDYALSIEHMPLS